MKGTRTMSNLYKYSRFNIIVKEEDNRVLLYNTYSLRYRWIPKSDFDDIKDKSNIDLGDIPVHFAEEGFIVKYDIDEIQRLKDDVKAHTNKSEFMYLSIFTTLACNYRCTYCFEKDQLCQTEHMTTETADEIISFIKRRYAEHQFTKSLKIKWFGGEPLINMKIIRYISDKLISNNIYFHAKMYTNGRLLTKELAHELKDLGVTDNVAIPIDGLAPTYAKLKDCKEEDFYKTIQNIKDAEDILNIVIHINISEASKADAKKLYELLRHKYEIRSPITPVIISPHNTDIITKSNSIEFRDFRNIVESIRCEKEYYIGRQYGCEARQQDYYVIGTNGELYICEHLVGQKEYIVGNIKDTLGRINKTDTIFDSNRVIDDCKDCQALPVCLGLCSSKRYIDNIDCKKEDHIQAIKKYVLNLIKNRQD